MVDRIIREKFREGVIATLLLDQQSGHTPTNEHFADRITLLFDHYCDVEDITNEVIKKIEGLAVSNKGEISLHKKLGEHLTEVGAYNTALSDVIELLKQPEKQEIERLNVALEVNHSPILSVENKLNEVIEAVNKLLEK